MRILRQAEKYVGMHACVHVQLYSHILRMINLYPQLAHLANCLAWIFLLRSIYIAYAIGFYIHVYS